MNKGIKYAITLVILLALMGVYWYEAQPQNPFTASIGSNRNEIIITDQRVHHILHGNGTSGGHKFGTNTPCKSEFPADWDDNQIIETAKRIAANDNLDWKQGKNGYFVADETVNGIKVRVVLGEQKRSIITSYPLNVKRNPCKREAANDP